MWAELKIRKSEKKSELWNICSQLWEKVLIVKCYLKIADVKLYLKEIKSKMCFKSELQDKTCTSEKKVRIVRFSSNSCMIKERYFDI